MRLALGIEYDGSRFLGWQTQPGGGTVQDALQAAMAAISSQQVKVTCAGRTDRGVHAREQVIHFDPPTARPDSAWLRGVNAMLPDSVAVLWVRPVDDAFHARFSAISRSYRYILINRGVRPALAAGRAGWFHRALDLESMRHGSECLLGEHDFSAFRSAECQARTPVRRINRLEIERIGDRIDFVITANAFLHHMVRNIVGALVYVGMGKHPPAWVHDVLGSRDRARAAPTFGPEGLYLEAVEYAPQWDLPTVRRAPTALPVEF